MVSLLQTGRRYKESGLQTPPTEDTPIKASGLQTSPTEASGLQTPPTRDITLQFSVTSLVRG